MTNRMRFSLTGLTASLAVLVALASVQPVNADITCEELAACDGSAECPQGADEKNCVLECNGGGTIVCEWA